MMIKKHIFEIDGTEIELTPEQCQQLRDELLRLYPGDYLLTQLPVSSPIQPIPPVGDDPLWPYSPWPRPPYDGYPVITSGRVGCDFRDVSVWQ